MPATVAPSPAMALFESQPVRRHSLRHWLSEQGVRFTGQALSGGLEQQQRDGALSDGGHRGKVADLMQRDELAGGVLGLVLGLCC